MQSSTLERMNMKIGSEEIKGWKDWTITLAVC
jgi:hypothetical protein